MRIGYALFKITKKFIQIKSLNNSLKNIYIYILRLLLNLKKKIIIIWEIAKQCVGAMINNKLVH